MGALCGGPNTKDCKIYGEEYKEKNLFIITCVDGGKKGTCPAADAKNGSILACQGTNSVYIRFLHPDISAQIIMKYRS